MDSPLNMFMLKQVSDEMVIWRGGGEGKESAYAEAVPNGSPIMLEEVVMLCL